MMVKEWLSDYHPSNEEQAKDALREIMQQVALAGFYRAGFFEKAAFYGGTALRIFYGIERFSEDLDFSLLAKDPVFSLNKYQDAIIKEFDDTLKNILNELDRSENDSEIKVYNLSQHFESISKQYDKTLKKLAK